MNITERDLNTTIPEDLDITTLRSVVKHLKVRTHRQTAGLTLWSWSVAFLETMKSRDVSAEQALRFSNGEVDNMTVSELNTCVRFLRELTYQLRVVRAGDVL